MRNAGETCEKRGRNMGETQMGETCEKRVRNV